MKYLSIFSLLSLLLFSACRPEPLEIDIPLLPPKVVVFSQIIPNEFMTVALTRTVSALGFSEEQGDEIDQELLDLLLETNAVVTVSYRDVTDTLYEVTTGTGIYISISTPQYVNELYTLNIVRENGETLSAENKMLPLINFNEITPIIERSDEDTLVKVNYRIVDLPGDNWYMLNVYSNQEEGEEEEGIDLNSFFQSGSNVLRKTELLTDAVFTNNVFEGSIELPNVSPMDSIVVTLSNINEEYYRFLEIRKNSSNFFAELTKEPVTLPTNVEGGLGFFNTHFPDLHYFDLNEY